MVGHHPHLPRRHRVGDLHPQSHRRVGDHRQVSHHHRAGDPRPVSRRPAAARCPENHRPLGGGPGNVRRQGVVMDPEAGFPPVGAPALGQLPVYDPGRTLVAVEVGAAVAVDGSNNYVVRTMADPRNSGPNNR